MFFSELSTIFEQIEQTTSRITMTELLSGLFRQTSATEIRNVAYLLQGRVAPLYEPVEFGVADKFMIRAISLAFDIETDDVVTEFRKVGDLGKAAQVIKQQSNKASQRHEKLTVDLVFEKLTEITGTGGEGSQDKKIALIADLLLKVDPLSARYIVRIPLGKMRLGFSDMTILDSLSWMLAGDKSLRDRLEIAYSVHPDIGLIAEKVKSKGIEGVSHMKAVVGAPILSALCQRLPTADEMIEKMQEVSVEPKYDGVRVQIHFSAKGLKTVKGVAPSKIRTFSRNLENTSEMFPELDQIGKELHAEEVILDCEAVGVDAKTGRILPFQETTTRKRKHGIEEAQKSVPLRFYVFDILLKDEQDLLITPLSERRKILEKTIKEGDLLAISPHIVTDDPATIREYHAKQIHLGLEGVVIKKWQGMYESGRRSYNWVKFKEEEGKTGKLQDTIDTIVMGYYLGEGKRSGFGIGAFLVGVRKEDTVVTVTKIGTGVSDEQWKELLKKFTPLIEKEKPKQYETVSKNLVPDVWLTPEVVVEIAGDDLTKSPTHGAGFAVRFPRLIKIRDDKSPAQATSVKEIEEMFRNQSGMGTR